MASPNNSSKLEAKPSKSKEINNHFPKKKQEDLLKDRKRERRGEGPKMGDLGPELWAVGRKTQVPWPTTP